MKTSDIRRVIDASLSGLELTPARRAALFDRAVGGEGVTPPRRKSPRKLIRRLLLAALILLLTLLAVIPAVGGQRHVAELKQTDDSLNLRFGHSADSGESFEPADFPPELGALWGEDFLSLLIEWRAQVLLPRWVPEGFVPGEVDVIPEAYVVNDWLFRGDESIHLNLRVLPDGEAAVSGVWIESEPGTEETWTFGGISYHYTANHSSSTVAWTEGNCAVFISAPRDREMMLRMIESIYEPLS